MHFRIARIDTSRAGGIVETRAKVWDFREQIKYMNTEIQTYINT